MKEAGKLTKSKRCWSAFSLLMCLLFLLALGLHGVPAKAQNATILVGSGSSVPAPLYNRWTQEYGKRNSGIQLRYLTVGTSEGIKQISHGAGDFGAGEAQLSEKERKEGGLIELPVVLIGIVPIYNLPDVHELRLSGEVLAGIFLGDIKSWNAPQIAKLNPGSDLPNLPIQVINRPAGKGSNFVFTEFLSKTSSKFRAEIGTQPFSQVARRHTGGTQFRHGRKGEDHSRLHRIRRISICSEERHFSSCCTKFGRQVRQGF